MEKKWFVFADQLVRGPLTTNNVEEGLTSGRWTLDTLIWWKGQNQWISIGTWRQQLPEISLREKKSGQQEWYIESGGNQIGPMTRTEVIEFLNNSPNAFQYSLWHPGMDSWRQLYFFEEVLADLGKSRRVHPRAPLPGAAEISKRDHKFLLQTSNISPGGIGLLNAQSLVPGQTVQLTIRSPAFPDPIHTNGQILYIRGSGFAGVKFESMHIEAQSTIIDYVRQFEEQKLRQQPPLPVKKTA